MTIFRLLLNYYRSALYFINSRVQKQVMPNGVQCEVVTDIEMHEKYKGDILHPCVRFTEQGFRGYHWWMIYSPYYKANPSLENPILCYGSTENNQMPVKWKFHSLIRNTPKTGYNSDPTIFFDNNDLNIFWRENGTERTIKDNVFRAIYGLVLNQNNLFEIEKPILTETNKYFDKEVSPTIIVHNGKYLAYAADVRFQNKNLHFKNASIDRILNKIVKILSVFDLYNEQKSYGLAIYESNYGQFDFQYKKTVKIRNCNRLYNPWHFDFFEFENKLYSIVQTNQFNPDICLAVSDDYETFRMFRKPLITQKSINKLGLYKATGIVQNNILHIYYSAQDIDHRGQNKLYHTSLIMSDLLIRLLE